MISNSWSNEYKNMPNSAKVNASAYVADSADDIPLQRFVTYRLNELSNRLNRQADRFFSENFDLPLTQWRILANLRIDNEISVRDLVILTQMDKGLISRAVAKLVKRGLVKSQPDPRDGRLLLLSRTEEGEQLANTIFPRSRFRQVNLRNCLTQEEFRAFDRALDKLVQFAREQEHEGYGFETPT